MFISSFLLLICDRISNYAGFKEKMFDCKNVDELKIAVKGIEDEMKVIWWSLKVF
jgi:hypothetical protein